MGKAELIIRITTYEGANYRNNQVCMELPKEIAEALQRAWETEKFYVRESTRASYLAANQDATCILKIDGRVKGGTYNMVRVDCCKDEVAHFIKKESKNI